MLGHVPHAAPSLYTFHTGGRENKMRNVYQALQLTNDRDMRCLSDIFSASLSNVIAAK